jgi:hypothetical protein
MTPKEKAEDLISIFLSITVSHYDDLVDGIRDGLRIIIAKKSALIAVDEILKLNVFEYYKSDWSNTIEYWEEVKQELEKL